MFTHLRLEKPADGGYIVRLEVPRGWCEILHDLLPGHGPVITSNLCETYPQDRGGEGGRGCLLS